jgi:hypothetical protein
MIPHQDLQPLLRAPYDRRAWTAMLHRLFPGLEAFEKPQRREVEDFHADEILQIGSIRLADDRRIAVLEVRIGRQAKLLRNRVGLRNLVASFIDQQAAHGVLAVFRSHEPAFRLTFASRSSDFDADGQLVRRETAPRRYTFVLGPGESCRTAAERLERLSSRGDAATLADVAEAFSVEKLNREFFDRYRTHYDRFVAHTLGAPDTAAVFGLPRRFARPDQKDKALKPVRDFVKKLLGRLVFLHFLQKKGWLGCPAGHSDWTGGDPDFLQTWFGRTRGHDRFYRSFLVPLFYEALNRADRPDDLFEPAGSRVPYLNGGLFERESLPVEDLDLPDALFAELLDFLGQYNFTVDENDPEDHEIGIDPEMLGHIFENLLEDNKDKGAFYTPKSIVQYMGQQSLIHYLQTHLSPATDGQRAALETLVRHKDAGDPKDKANWIRSNAREIERLLDDVKICDPAIGSGAFPIGLLQEIFWIKLTLDWTLDGAETKRRIIQNSIYGVDIDAGAVEIARLRCWLALVVEEDRPRPLPNLDYKIMQGDSLLESFEGIPLDRLHGPTAGTPVQSSFADFGAPAQEGLPLTTERAADLRRMTDTYFESYDPAEKARLHSTIDRLVLDHLDYNIRQKLDDLSERIAKTKTSFARKLSALKKDQRAAYSRTAKEKTLIAKLEREYQETLLKKDKLKALAVTHERPYFLWHLFFQDVFARGGFDIAIANPPYVRMELFKEIKAALRESYPEVHAERADLYCYFYSRALTLLRQNGILCFISSNKFFRAGYGSGLRNHLIKETELLRVIDFRDLPIFEATTYPAILLAQRRTPTPGHAIGTLTVLREEDVADFAQMATTSILQSEFKWRLESRDVLTLVEKLAKRGERLGARRDSAIYRGIVSGLNEAFIVDAATRDALVKKSPRCADVLKPYLGGKHVRKWACEQPNLWMIYMPHGTPVAGLDAIIDHLEPFRTKLNARATAQAWYELQQPQEKFLEAYTRPKIIFPDIANELRFALDTRGSFFSNTAYCIAADDLFLLAILNSSVVQFFYTHLSAQIRGGYLRLWTQYVEQIPIPGSDDESRLRLEALARRAAKAAGAELAAIEREIDAIVYRLFDLTPDEIALIERATGGAKAGLDNKTALFTRVLPELKERAPYFSLDAVRRRLSEIEVGIAPGSLLQYMSEAMAGGLVHDAGHGWYSRIEKPLILDGRPVARLIRAVASAFPKVDFACWSTAQINPFTRHLLGRHTAFLYADPDFLPSIADRLREAGWDVLADPNRKTAREQHRPGDKAVILRPALSKQPEGQDHQAPPEKVLVDLVVEADDANLMDADEARLVFASAAMAGRINISAADGYASRRRVELRCETDSETPRNPILWS